jgi:hypothetical protein
VPLFFRHQDDDARRFEQSALERSHDRTTNQKVRQEKLRPLHSQSFYFHFFFLRRFFLFILNKKVVQRRDDNRPDSRVKRQFRDLVRPSKLHTRPTRFIPSGLKISARPVCGPSFYDPARPDPFCSAVFLNRLRNIFLSILGYKFEKT